MDRRRRDEAQLVARILCHFFARALAHNCHVDRGPRLWRRSGPRADRAANFGAGGRGARRFKPRCRRARRKKRPTCSRRSSGWSCCSLARPRFSLILLLVSADFIASDYCYDVEMTRALERHQNREARVIPVMVRDVHWRDAPFCKLQCLPKDGRAVALWENRDSAWKDVAIGIGEAAREPLSQVSA